MGMMDVIGEHILPALSNFIVFIAFSITPQKKLGTRTAPRVALGNY